MTASVDADHDPVLPPACVAAGVTVSGRFAAGELGELIRLHGLGNAQDYGYSVWHEAYCARIAADFVIDGGGERGRVWLARHAGQVIGSVFIVEAAADVAQLRLLYVAAAWRGRGLGRWLVKAAVAHCRLQRFAAVFLWTAEGLDAARRLYQTAGFALSARQRAENWGVVTEELRFDLALASAAS